MKTQHDEEKTVVLTRDLFFRPDENVHIQTSNEFPDYIDIMHTHEYIEVAYIISGTATHEIAGKTYNVKRGDLFVINMNTPHVFRKNKSNKNPFVAFDLMFTLDFFDSSKTGSRSLEELTDSFMFYSLFHSRNGFPPYFSVSGSDRTMFGELFNKILLEYRGRKKGYLEIIRAYLLELIITIFRLDDESSGVDTKSKAHQVVNYTMSYIREHYNQRLSVSSLADRVFLTPDYLGRVFRDTTGVSIGTMIQKTRIEQACYLLSTTDNSVTDIAAACGFDDMSFFYSVFKKHMSILPAQYRKQVQNT